MAIITLTSDMGTSDHYVAAVKGAILSQLKDAVIADISHHIAPFNNRHAAFVLANAWPEFPAGTIHIIGVNPEADGETPHLAVRHKGHYFIGADSGIFHLLFEAQPEAVVELTIKLDTDHLTFPTKNIFVKAACHLARGGTMELLGRPLQAVREQINVRPVVSDGAIKGEVIHVDHYGNVITNIHQDLFSGLVKHQAFKLTFGPSRHNITALHKTYSDVPPGERVAFFGDAGLLEIAVNKGVVGNGGGASQLLGLRVTDPVRLEVVAVNEKAIART
ncbi:MAG: SAM-dependent chlorinase/fluorinase [Flavobacteriales bacterium]|nr:SAM-dependent chlorinase/fluorinase [Flavobacteriales bacterium]MBP9079321.1 SAM-dependent chlorinase/fluorinase [Flavobacteriales bacterium]